MANYYINKPQMYEVFATSSEISLEGPNFRSNSAKDIALDICVDTSSEEVLMEDNNEFNFNTGNYRHDHGGMVSAPSFENLAETTLLKKKWFNGAQVYNDLNLPVYKPNTNKGIYQFLFKPNIQILPETKILKLPDEVQDIKYQISITTPGVIKSPQMTAKETDRKTRIRRQIEESLFFQFQELFSDLDPGDLLFFDNLLISTNEEVWDTLTCYFFRKIIIMVHHHELVGQINLQDICSMNKVKNGFVLNLTRDMIPELHVSHENPIVLLKWRHYLNYYITNKEMYPEARISILQLTTNAWDIVSQQELTQDIREFSKAIKNNSEVPESLVGQVLPSMESIPLNLIISVSLVNSTSMSNQKYREYVIKTLRKAKESLRDKDTLGLICVGIDKTGRFSKNGTFVGFIDSSWEGWEEIFERIEVFSKSIGITIAEEFSIVINKCNLLSLFLPQEKNCLNKLIFISSNKDIHANSPLQNIEAELSGLLNKVSISFVIVSNSSNTELNYINRMLSKTQNASSKEGTLAFGTTLTPVESWDTVPSMVCKLIDTYQITIIPSVHIRINCDSKNVSVTDIESGREINMPMDHSEFSISVNGLEPRKTRVFEIKLRVNPGSHHIRSTSFMPVIKYQTSWLDEVDVVREVKTVISH